jgi:hypothetical protein
VQNKAQPSNHRSFQNSTEVPDQTDLLKLNFIKSLSCNIDFQKGETLERTQIIILSFKNNFPLS